MQQVAIDACELAKAAAKHHAELLEAAERRRLQKEKEEAQEALFKVRLSPLIPAHRWPGSCMTHEP